MTGSGGTQFGIGADKVALVPVVIIGALSMVFLLFTSNCAATPQSPVGAAGDPGGSPGFELTGETIRSDTGEISVSSAVISDGRAHLFYVIVENNNAASRLENSQFTVITDTAVSELLMGSELMRLDGFTVGVLTVQLVSDATEYSVSFAGAPTAPVMLRRLGGPDAHAGVSMMNNLPLAGPLPFQTAFTGRAVVGPDVLAFEIFVAGSDGIKSSTALSIDKNGVLTVINSDDLGELLSKYAPWWQDTQLGSTNKITATATNESRKLFATSRESSN